MAQCIWGVSQCKDAIAAGKAISEVESNSGDCQDLDFAITSRLARIQRLTQACNLHQTSRYKSVYRLSWLEKLPISLWLGPSAQCAKAMDRPTVGRKGASSDQWIQVLVLRTPSQLARDSEFLALFPPGVLLSLHLVYLVSTYADGNSTFQFNLRNLRWASLF